MIKNTVHFNKSHLLSNTQFLTAINRTIFKYIFLSIKVKFFVILLLHYFFSLFFSFSSFFFFISVVLNRKVITIVDPSFQFNYYLLLTSAK